MAKNSKSTKNTKNTKTTAQAEAPVVMVERVNLMTQKTYMEAQDTPGFMSPSREAYWCM